MSDRIDLNSVSWNCREFRCLGKLNCAASLSTGMDHRRMHESLVCLQTVSLMTHPAVHPIRSSYGSTATRKKAAFSRSTTKVLLPTVATLMHIKADGFFNSFTRQLSLHLIYSSLQTPVLLTPFHHPQCRNPDGKQRVQNRYVAHLFLIQTIILRVPGLSMCGERVCGLCQCTQNILNIEAGCQFIFRLERLSLIMFPE